MRQLSGVMFHLVAQHIAKRVHIVEAETGMAGRERGRTLTGRALGVSISAHVLEARATAGKSSRLVQPQSIGAWF